MCLNTSYGSSDDFAVEEHQQFQIKIQEVQKEIEKKDKIIFDIAGQLRKAEAILQQIVDDGKKQLEIIEQSQKGSYHNPYTMIILKFMLRTIMLTFISKTRYSITRCLRSQNQCNYSCSSR